MTIELDIPAIIKEYADKEIFIEVLADGYKLGGICWRGYVYWKHNDSWIGEDCGCFPEWIDAFNSVVSTIHDWVVHNQD